MMNITANRPLGAEEKEHLEGVAAMMDVQKKNKDWTGDGVLFRRSKGSFFFIDQAAMLVTGKGKS